MSNPNPRFKVLFPESDLPPLDTPYDLFGGLVVFTMYSARIRIREEHLQQHDEGFQLVGHIGEWGRYCEYRAATTLEAAKAFKQIAVHSPPKPNRNKPRKPKR